MWMINVEGLEVSYGRFKEPVLRSVNAVFDDKSLVLGPNGSGKTTLFRALCGLARASITTMPPFISDAPRPYTMRLWLIGRIKPEYGSYFHCLTMPGGVTSTCPIKYRVIFERLLIDA